MTSLTRDLQHRADILIHELMADEELCLAFLSDPERTLRSADDWGLPFSESEVVGFRGRAHQVWERVVETLEARVAAA